MRARRIGTLTPALALVTLLVLVGQLGAAAVTAYNIVDLGTLPRSYDPLVRGFNSRGQMVGAAPNSGAGPGAIVLTQGALETIGGLPGSD